jgi:hypothetical protein
MELLIETPQKVETWTDFPSMHRLNCLSQFLSHIRRTPMKKSNCMRCKKSRAYKKYLALFRDISIRIIRNDMKMKLDKFLLFAEKIFRKSVFAFLERIF